MKLMHTFRDGTLTLNNVTTENRKFIRWSDKPLEAVRIIKYSTNLIKISKGTVMPKQWMR